MESQRVRHDWVTSLSSFFPSFLPPSLPSIHPSHFAGSQWGSITFLPKHICLWLTKGYLLRQMFCLNSSPVGLWLGTVFRNGFFFRGVSLVSTAFFCSLESLVILILWCLNKRARDSKYEIFHETCCIHHTDVTCLGDFRVSWSCSCFLCQKCVVIVSLASRHRNGAKGRKSETVAAILRWPVSTELGENNKVLYLKFLSFGKTKEVVT